jgi:hypothetical protein
LKISPIWKAKVEPVLSFGMDNFSQDLNCTKALEKGWPCKENGPLAHLVWILVFDDQHGQVGLMDLKVFVL